MRYFNVPMIRQEKQMSCWHASARMLWAFKYRQCIDPLSKVFQANTGVSPAQFVDLARELGLETVPEINMTYSWNGVDDLLKRHGPLWAAGKWYGPNHIIVVTGVDADGTLYVNDPGLGQPRVHDMRFFNDKIAKSVRNPSMYLRNSRATAAGFSRVFD